MKKLLLAFVVFTLAAGIVGAQSAGTKRLTLNDVWAILEEDFSKYAYCTMSPEPEITSDTSSKPIRLIRRPYNTLGVDDSDQPVTGEKLFIQIWRNRFRYTIELDFVSAKIAGESRAERSSDVRSRLYGRFLRDLNPPSTAVTAPKQEAAKQ